MSDSPNRQEEVTVQSLAFQGVAVARLSDGKVCFLKNALPGEKVRIGITAENKSFCRGEVLEILESSAKRRRPPCPHFPTCPGCAYLHTDYETEFAAKQEQFRHFLLHGTGISEKVILPATPAEHRLQYRNKIVFHIKGNQYCYVGEDNQTLFPAADCLLAKKELGDFIQRTPATRNTEKALFRWTCHDGAKLISDFKSKNAPPLWDNVGTDYLFQVHPRSFFQINPEMSGKLANHILSVLKQEKTDFFVELYSGVGVFSILTAKTLPSCECHAVEIDKDAVDNARINAKHHGVESRCHFIAESAEKFAFRRIANAIGKQGKTCLLVDPPRTGIEAGTLRRIEEFAPDVFIYVSCSPDTLARDLKRILPHGNYEAISAAMFDMFPATSHFESVCVLTKH